MTGFSFPQLSVDLDGLSDNKTPSVDHEEIWTAREISKYQTGLGKSICFLYTTYYV